MSESVRLHVTGGPMKGKVFAFGEHNTFIFGRDSACHAPLPDDNFISRHHFIVETAPPDARLWDLGSLNGTYVNKQLCGSRAPDESPEEGAMRTFPSVDLRNDDVIHVGETRISVVIDFDEQSRLSDKEQRCSVCKKEVGGEFGNRVDGAYVCAQCRRAKRGDRIGLFATLEAYDDSVQNSTSLEEYEIEDKLGEGGMGAVYRAKHIPSGEPVAVKVILNTIPVKESSVNGFLREMEVLKSLKHPNIVRYRGGCARKGGLFVAMELCNRGDVVSHMVENGGYLEPDAALPIMRDILQGLAFAHRQGIVHRDIKPGNLLLDKQNGVVKAKLCDFGLAKNYETAGMSGMTLTNQYAGTLAFIPTEQVTNYKYVKPVSDVWSLGAAFYNMLTGEYPRDFDTGDDALSVILKNEVVPIRRRRSDIPANIADVIDKSLAPETRKRYQTGEEFLKALA